MYINWSPRFVPILRFIDPGVRKSALLLLLLLYIVRLFTPFVFLTIYTTCQTVPLVSPCISISHPLGSTNIEFTFCTSIVPENAAAPPINIALETIAPLTSSAFWGDAWLIPIRLVLKSIHRLSNQLLLSMLQYSVLKSNSASSMPDWSIPNSIDHDFTDKIALSLNHTMSINPRNAPAHASNTGLTPGLPANINPNCVHDA